MISAEEFDRKFDDGESIDEYLDLQNPILLEELAEYKVTINLSKEMKEKLVNMSKRLNLSFEDTIKALLAKEVGLI